MYLCPEGICLARRTRRSWHRRTNRSLSYLPGSLWVYVCVCVRVLVCFCIRACVRGESKLCNMLQRIVLLVYTH